MCVQLYTFTRKSEKIDTKQKLVTLPDWGEVKMLIG